MSSSAVQSMAQTINERSRTLINNDLKRICKEEGTSQTGNKAALQARVQGLVTSATMKGDTETLRRLLYRVQNHGDTPPSSVAPASSSPTSPPYHKPPPSAPTNGYGSASNGFQANPAYSPYAQQPTMANRNITLFKESPFFEIRECLVPGFVLQPSPSHRQAETRNLILNETQCARLRSDNSLRILAFGAIEQPINAYTRIDIVFPNQFEIKVNGEDVRANFKGLKNKPGSTRPADITSVVRTGPTNYRNVVQATYALTQKASDKQKYTLYVYLAKKFSVTELTQRIKQRRVITKQMVLNEMLEKANDPDIEVGSSVMSLKDPVSTVRITTPCRSSLCTHNQCFDAESFLQLQEQAPTWTCPICNKTISYEALAVDQYVEEILSKVRNADQVTIQANGTWSTDKESTPPPQRNGYGHQDDSDDDLIEITDYRDRLTTIKAEAAPTPVSLSTPPLQSRETSTAPRSGNKRMAEVVDLTLDDDDEPRPAKKVAYHTPSSIPEPSRRYQLPPLPSHHQSAAHHSRPLPPIAASYMQSSRQEYPRPPSTPPERYQSYRPAQNNTRPSYPGQGTSQYPTYLGSSSP